MNIDELEKLAMAQMHEAEISNYFSVKVHRSELKTLCEGAMKLIAVVRAAGEVQHYDCAVIDSDACKLCCAIAALEE